MIKLIRVASNEKKIQKDKAKRVGSLKRKTRLKNPS